MYRVYVLKQRKGGSEVLTDTRTQTHSFAVAKAAFGELFQRDFDHRHLLLMSKDNQKLYVYHYQSQQGDEKFIELGAELHG